MSETIKHTTPGPFIVGETILKDDPSGRKHICIVCAYDTNKIVALTGLSGEADEAESIANAAFFATSPLMFKALMDIQALVNTSKETFDIEMINDMINTVALAIANEAGEEI